MKKIKVGLLYGGRSVEHAISINSARNVEKHIDKSLFDLSFIGISKNGVWKQTSTVDLDIDKGNNLQLQLNPQKAGFINDKEEKFHIDIVFSMLHGTDGEDGNIQGLLKMMDIPLVGSGVLGSALAMNKLVSKQLMLQGQLPVVEFLHYHAEDKKNIQFDFLAAKLGIPFMVKAVNLGSSVGISKVDKKTDFLRALEDALRYDSSVLIEKYIPGREIECAVLDGNPPIASTPGEIIIGKDHPFYTFDAKYVDTKKVKIEVPAKLSPFVIKQIKKWSIQAFQLLHCQDFARVDLFLSHKGDIYINEINTIPGFTDSSMFPLMWHKEGISFSRLITQLIQLSLKRCKYSKKPEKDFKSTLTT